MSEEEKQAIADLKKYINKFKVEDFSEYYKFKEFKFGKTVLNLIEKQQKQIEEKSKKYVDLCFEAGKIKADLDIAERVIDKMAEELGKIGVFKHSKEQIKEYFYKEIENE